MQLKTAKHSDLLKLPKEVQELLYKKSVIPVLDQFVDIWDNKDKKLILAGSYGSGKSIFAVNKAIYHCINDPYFRCFYGRKVAEDIRTSIFPAIYEQIEYHNIKGFKYSTAANSSMIIEHENGNKFISFGADRIDKLKSIKEPTHFLLEELDQFTQNDFGMCMSRLGRTNKGGAQLIAMCNTENIYEEHWLYPILFGNGLPDTTVHWSNYRKNTLLPSIEDYEKNLRDRAMGNEDLYNAIANGTPGVKNRNSAWIHVNYDHCITEQAVIPIDGNTIILSFDFNNEPTTCTAWQFSSGIHRLNGEGHFIRCVAEFEASMAETDEEIISVICKKIKAAFPYNPLRVTGDSSGSARLKGVPGNKSLYILIARNLGISIDMVDVPASNMTHTASRTLCNLIMHNYKSMQISKVTTPKLYLDIRNAKADPDKQDQIYKPDRKKDSGAYKMDYFDTYRYIFATYFNYFLRN